MGSRADPNERFTHYFKKTFKKTASLLAYTCRSVSYCTLCTGPCMELFKEKTDPACLISGRIIGALREQTKLSWVKRQYSLNYQGWSTSRWLTRITRYRIPVRKEPWDGIPG